MMSVSEFVKKEFIDYRKCDILWSYIRNDHVLVRIPHYQLQDFDYDSVFPVKSSDPIPVVELSISETEKKMKRFHFTERNRYFPNNNMFSFLNEFRRKSV